MQRETSFQALRLKSEVEGDQSFEKHASSKSDDLPEYREKVYKFVEAEASRMDWSKKETIGNTDYG